MKRSRIFMATPATLVAAAVFAQMTWAAPLHIGSISDEPADEIKRFLPLSTYLAKHLQSEGITEVRVVVTKGIPQMAAWLREGKADLYIDSPFPSMAVSRLAGSKFLLRRWKKGMGEYHSVIFVRKDSGIDRLADLRGKMIAFEESYSSSGYFLPKMVLTQQGLRLVPKGDPSEPVGPAEVGYVFSNADENTMGWVVRGRLAAGVMDNQNFLKYAKENVDRLAIVHKTFSIPRQIVSYRADLSPKLVARIREVLIAMDQSEGGKQALHEFERTTRFDDLSEQALAPLRRLQKFIDAEFGLR
jgi:phosphonate transport system substrate-binding protein